MSKRRRSMRQTVFGKINALRPARLMVAHLVAARAQAETQGGGSSFYGRRLQRGVLFPALRTPFSYSSFNTAGPDRGETIEKILSQTSDRLLDCFFGKTKADLGMLCMLRSALVNWLRRQDLNLRPSGYEPDELPDCSTPRYLYCVNNYTTASGGCQPFPAVCKRENAIGRGPTFAY